MTLIEIRNIWLRRVVVLLLIVPVAAYYYTQVLIRATVMYFVKDVWAGTKFVWTYRHPEGVVLDRGDYVVTLQTAEQKARAEQA